MARQEPPIPDSLAAVWGRRERPSRGPKPGLTLDRVVEAGVRVARTEGLGAVSMARVAEELGGSTMSLYRYVAAKDELLALMVDAALGPPSQGSAGEDWRAGLTRWAWGMHDRLREHPWTLGVPITGPPVAPNEVAWFEDGLNSLRDTDLQEDEMASVVLLVSGYVRNEAALVADLVAAETISDAAMSSYAALLEHLTTPARFPAIHALLAAGVFNTADHPDKEFVFGLERILDGVAVLVDVRSRGRGRRRPSRRASVS